jgi:hypothetical protein
MERMNVYFFSCDAMSAIDAFVMAHKQIRYKKRLADTENNLNRTDISVHQPYITDRFSYRPFWM